MIRYVLALAAMLAAPLLAAAPANAWVEESIAAAKAQRGEGSSAAPRARAERQASAPRRATRQAAANDDDDGSRPQRRSAPRQQASESLSGGETGVASYYWQPQALASGGRFNPDAWTAAHKTLPFGTRVRVTRLDNGNSVEVTINDRGPYISGRIIDLSRRAAQAIGMTGQGVARVRVNVVGRG